MEVHGHTVRGVDVGPETRCRHYDSELDVIAIRFPCCGTFYACDDCHLAAADHESERWGDEAAGRSPTEDASADAVLCGVCGAVLTVAEYVDCDDRCPDCGAEFNPGCRRHYDRYFAEALFETA
ncbi:hypothetical protein B4589_010380 [Halolamina sp. CBA1230]|uniref:CHY zinc finger protein n=1 Tax=Halolamina sp. CBA1230 TaxID=1853690 RepID=UPI0009A19195|nr:CHY zinc finger protein [Halolamina sp. CBA1230]QKY20762.1 hypothetical protein B4589_010380 [Halolamina sp. CBA1230]